MQTIEAVQVWTGDGKFFKAVTEGEINVQVHDGVLEISIKGKTAVTRRKITEIEMGPNTYGFPLDNVRDYEVIYQH